MRRTPALILGGGPAGAAAAIRLAVGGVRPLVLERSQETGDALCGGFLSWRTLQTLAQLGVDADALNLQPVTRVRLFAGARVAESGLPSAARGVSRRRLDALLLARAEAAGADIERGVAVRSLADGVAQLADGSAIAGDALLLATGKHDLRGVARPAIARGVDPTLGLRVRLDASQALTRLIGDSIELHLFDRGYAGLVLQEDGSANLCMAVHRSRLAESGDPAALLLALARECPPLGDRLAHMAPGATIDAIANVPYGWRARSTAPGLYRLGDQAGVIPSLAGEGMGIAIASGIRAADAVLGGTDSQAYQARLATDLARPIGLAALIWRLAEGSRTAGPLVMIAQAVPKSVETAARLTRIGALGR
jgi:flavin-dependent dehydrogenase